MYLNIKIKVALCMAGAMILSLLAGCAKEEPHPMGTISDFESQAHIQVSTPEDESTHEEASQPTLSGEFVVSEKKYDYKNGNIMLLYVENQTDQHYNVTIKGKYLDENGKVIKEESQTYKAFPAGWSNHFIFYPQVVFDSFVYELETEEYVHDTFYSDRDGTPFVSFVELTYEKKIEWQRALIGDTANPDEGRSMFFYGKMSNNHPAVEIAMEFHVLVLDANGNIYKTDLDNDNGSVSGTATDPIGGPDNGIHRFPIYLMEQLRGLDESIPDNVQGVFTAIFAILDVVDMGKVKEQW